MFSTLIAVRVRGCGHPLCHSFVSDLASGRTELVEAGREQPFKPGRIGPALQAQ
jgi:hypothetical protein